MTTETTETTRDKAIRVMAEVLDGFTGKITTPETEAMRALDAILEHVGPVMAEVEGNMITYNGIRDLLLSEQKAKQTTEPLNLTDEQQRALVEFARWVIMEMCPDYDSLGDLELKADELGLLSEADKSMGIDVAHWLKDDANDQNHD